MSVFDILRQGLTAQTVGDLATAEACYRQVLQQDPRNQDAHHLLGAALRSSGRTLESIVSISQAIAIAPDQATFYNSLGNCYLDKSEWVVAELAYRKALDLTPALLEAVINLGFALQRQQRLAEAQNVLQNVLAQNPDNELALCNMGQVLRDEHRHAQALEHYRHVLSLNRRSAEALIGSAACLTLLGQSNEALELLDAVITIAPKRLPEIMHLKGTVLQALGRLDDACESFDRGLESSPGNVALAYARSHLKKIKKEERYFELVTGYAPHVAQLQGRTRTQYSYALGKAYQDVGDFASAAKYYADGGQALLSSVDKDPQEEDKILQITQQEMTAECLAGLAKYAVADARPIFILGMPRSGTTLTEQILATHPDVFAGGELNFWPASLDGFSIEGGELAFSYYSENAPPATANLRDRALHYLAAISTLEGNSGKRFVTDKLPGNFLTLGLIATVFPNAKIIHCRRDPIDNCISCYTTLFTAGHQWSFDQIATGKHFRRYWELMNHWRTVMPGRVLEVRYEQMVEDQEGMSRKILAWCGLEWDEQVLKFHETKRAVMTASVTQVRQPIYTSSMGRWRKWKPYIQPLMDEIRDLEIAYWDEVGIKIEL